MSFESSFRITLSGLAITATVALTGCGQLIGKAMMGAMDGASVNVTNASSVPVCAVNIWKDSAAPGEAAPDYNWLDTGPIQPGSRVPFGTKKSADARHFRAKTCDGTVLAQQDIVIDKDVAILVH